MGNIVNYFNSLLSYIFGSRLTLLSFDIFASQIYALFTPTRSFEEVLFEFFRYPSLVFSSVVWIWFAWLSIHLLLIWPFNWLRSIIRKCRG